MPRAITYCTKDDLLIGDIPLAAKYGDGSGFVDLAADHIDAQLGSLFVTPFQIDPGPPANKPAVLTLKMINQLLASGRIILDMAAGGEDAELHAYGASMVRDANAAIAGILGGKIQLVGATPIGGVDNSPNNRVSIHNEDPYSLVQGFYQGMANPLMPNTSGAIYPMRPYDVLPSESDA